MEPISRKKRTILIVVIVCIIGLVSTLYYFVVYKPAHVVVPVSEQTKAEILARFTAPLDKQSTSDDLRDIKADIQATDFSIIGQGLSK